MSSRLKKSKDKRFGHKTWQPIICYFLFKQTFASTYQAMKEIERKCIEPH